MADPTLAADLLRAAELLQDYAQQAVTSQSISDLASRLRSYAPPERAQISEDARDWVRVFGRGDDQIVALIETVDEEDDDDGPPRGDYQITIRGLTKSGLDVAMKLSGFKAGITREQLSKLLARLSEDQVREALSGVIAETGIVK